MVLPRFEVIEPKTISEVCIELARLKNSNVRLLAGGTDLFVDIRKKILPEHLPRCSGCPPESNDPQVPMKPPEFLISLSRINELKGIYVDESTISIGAMTTITELTESDIIGKYLGALAQGADSLGSPLVRNRGTIGGNIANARPAADTFIPAVALEGTICVSSSDGNREIPADSFAEGPGQTVLKKNEFITHLIFEKYRNKYGSAYQKLANRKALEISTISVGAFLLLSDDLKGIEKARIALGAVGPTPILATNAMNYLQGKEHAESIFNEASKLAAKDAKPITDHRSSREYRLEMVEVITKRVLDFALKRALKRN